MILGMDFGTTNSGMAVAHGHEVQMIPFEQGKPAGGPVIPTLLYITRAGEYSIGQQAMETYYRQNLGRPVKLVRKWMGQIQVTFAETGTYWTDIYAWIDELQPGRLFRSIKGALGDRSFLGTTVWEQFYTLEDLIGLYLLLTRIQAERWLGQPVREILLGRPVHFSAPLSEIHGDPLAEERLARAALLAGYERVAFELEPVAAAYSYLQTQSQPQIVLVFDFGGGTLDLSILRVDRDRATEILAVNGVAVAGDVFDQRLFRSELAGQFGESVVYGPRSLPMPAYLYDEICDWQNLLLLNRPDILRLLREVEATTAQPRPIRALLSLITGNYGLALFAEVERVKIELSSQVLSRLHFEGGDIHLDIQLSRMRFEKAIANEIAAIERCLDDTLQMAGLKPSEIDAVVRTGGSSLIPYFQHLLACRFGADRLQAIDAFSSVTAGLGIIAATLDRQPDRRIYDVRFLDKAAPAAENPVLCLRQQVE